MDSRLSPLRRFTAVVWSNLHTNDLWQRIVKYAIAAVIALVIAILPPVIGVYGTNTFLTPVTTVFAHPGQRMGLMIESLLMIVLGSMLGLSWSLLGLYLSNLASESDVDAGYAIRAVFLLVAVVVHGFLRSSSPRLFVFVLFLLIVSVMILIGKAGAVTTELATSFIFPILTGAGVLLVVNLSVFPELSSNFLGTSTIETLSEVSDTLTRATMWFVTPGGDAAAAEEIEPLIPNGSAEIKKKKKKGKGKGGKKKKKKKKTWWDEFLAGFPNPFQTAQKPRTTSLPPHLTRLVNLTESKAKLRARLGRCKAAQQEVNFEIAVSSLAPALLKPISSNMMTSLVQNTITLIGACENKFVILGEGRGGGKQPGNEGPSDVHLPRRLPGGDEDQQEPMPGDPYATFTRRKSAASPKESTPKDEYVKKLQFVKPLREIEAADAEMLESMLRHIRRPVEEFVGATKQAVALIVSCVAYCFDVPRLPSGAQAPKGIRLEEIDIRVDMFTEALERFDQTSTEALEQAAKSAEEFFDMMPRMETFLVSSFLLGVRQAAMHVLQMLKQARALVEKRQMRKDRSRIYLPQYTNLKQYLATGGEEDGMILPEAARKEARAGNASVDAGDESDASSTVSDEPLLRAPDDEERQIHRVGTFRGTMEMQREQKKQRRRKRRARKRREKQKAARGWWVQARGRAADFAEWLKNSDDLTYALKLAVAVFLVSWPGFTSSWNAWYSSVRGVWAPLQLILVFEVAIGTSLFVFFVRLFGVLFGCLMGYLAFEISRGNRAVIVVVLLFGIVPSIYIQVGTKYVKAGMISIVSMTVVALSTVNKNGSAVENFYKRLVAFIIGGIVAMVIEIVLYPVRARDRMVESLSSCVMQVSNMQSAVAVGVDDPVKVHLRSPALHHRFNKAREKAQAALGAAETFLPFCLSEPRIKGSFKRLSPIYREIIYVLHQIIDRMDNVLQLRKTYGSSVLEELNPQVYAYRRNVAASTSLALFAVNEALTTRLPLPQFLPSSRLSQLRLVNRVREVLQEKGDDDDEVKRNLQAAMRGQRSSNGKGPELDEQTAKMVTQHKFLSWNASTAGQMEIIEYLEELVELAKLLVGVNAFRSGLLERPNFRQYMRRVKTREMSWGQAGPLSSAGLATEESALPSEQEQAAAGGAGPRPGKSLLASRIRSKMDVLRRMGAQPAAEAPEPTGQEPPEGSESSDDDSDDSDEGDALPMSLQRVGTRLWEDNAASRRRTPWSADGESKGKTVDRWR